MVLLLRDSEKAEILVGLKAIENSFTSYHQNLRHCLADFDSRLAKLTNTPPSSSLSLPPQPTTPTFEDLLRKFEIAKSPAAISSADVGQIAPTKPLPTSEPLSDTQFLPSSDGLDESLCCTPPFAVPLHSLKSLDNNCESSEENSSTSVSSFPVLKVPRGLQISRTMPGLQVVYGRAIITWTEEPPGAIKIRNSLFEVGCCNKVDKEKRMAGTRVAIDKSTLTIMRSLPRQVDPLVYEMIYEVPENVSNCVVGGLGDKIQELRDSKELLLMNPDIFTRVGIKPPKIVLLYGYPGTRKTLLARLIGCKTEANFLKVVSSVIIYKYSGEGGRLNWEMSGYVRDNQPCITFMDEIDAIAGRRLSERRSSDREIQRTLLELLNQLDGFDQLGKVKVMMATNRPDVLDPALLHPDRKIEIALSNEQSRMEILKIHASVNTPMFQVARANSENPNDKTRVYHDPSFTSRILKLPSSLIKDSSYTLLILKSNDPDSFCFSTVINKYAYSSCHAQAVDFYIEMLRTDDLYPNWFMFLPLINSCAKLSSLSSGQMFRGQAVKLGVSSVLISGPSSNGFYREILERIFYARGASAKGIFEVTHDISKLLCADFFRALGVQTPIIVWFPTVIHERGSPETLGDLRGFAVKIYTREGNFDLVGNNFPILLILDDMKFPYMVHALKPNPKSHIQENWRILIFFSHHLESLPMFSFLFGDLGIPQDYIHMKGSGVYTYTLINKVGKVHYVRFHWKPTYGVNCLLEKDAIKVGGANHSHATQDLYDSIAAGKYPEWKLLIQIIDPDHEELDPLDVTKTWPEDILPLQPVSHLVLNENIDKFFAENEQLHIVLVLLPPEFTIPMTSCFRLGYFLMLFRLLTSYRNYKVLTTLRTRWF